MELTHTSKHICLFRHALALDERHVKYLPELIGAKSERTSDERQGDEVSSKPMDQDTNPFGGKSCLTFMSLTTHMS